MRNGWETIAEKVQWLFCLLCQLYSKKKLWILTLDKLDRGSSYTRCCRLRLGLMINDDLVFLNLFCLFSVTMCQILDKLDHGVIMDEMLLLKIRLDD